MAKLRETFSGQAIVRAFNKEDAAFAAFRETDEALYQSAWRSQFLSGLMMPVASFVSNLGYVAVAIAGAVFAVQGRITVGDIQAFIQYVKKLHAAYHAACSGRQRATANGRGGGNAFSNSLKLLKKRPSSQAKAADVSSDVEFDHVRFWLRPPSIR